MDIVSDAATDAVMAIKRLAAIREAEDEALRDRNRAFRAMIADGMSAPEISRAMQEADPDVKGASVSNVRIIMGKVKV